MRNPTHRWVAYGAYQGAGFWNWARRNLNAGSVIVDSGANIGQTVVSFAALPQVSRIWAFEPGAAARAWLEECVTRNELSQVVILAQALGANRGRGVLSQAGPDTTHGAWHRVIDDPQTSGERVEITTLDAFAAESSLNRIDLWKLDMEGGELAALRGARALLESARIRNLLVELSGDGLRQIPEFLGNFGYRPQELTTWGRARPLRSASPYQDVLFSR